MAQAVPIERVEQAARSQTDERLRRDPRADIERGRSVFGDDGPDGPIEDEGPVFFIRSIETNQTEMLPPEKVREIVAPYENRQLSIGDIRRLVARIDAAYRAIRFKAGFAVVLDQDLSSGVLQIVLVEPRVDEVSITGLARVKPDYIASRVRLQSGEYFDLNGLERRLNLMNRMSAGGLYVEALLQPGRSFGTTSVQLNAHEAAPYEFTTIIDNYGSRETGVVRPFSMVRFSNLLGRDDVLQVGASGALNERLGKLGTWSGFVDYSMPLFGFTRLNMSASTSRSEIELGTFAPLGLATGSTHVTASVRAPLISSQRWLVAGDLGGEMNFSQTTAGPLRIDRRIREAFGQLDATFYGRNSGLQASLRVGHFDALITDNAGSTLDNYTTLSGGLFAYRRFGIFEARVRGNWQWTPNILLPASKQFTLGGPYSVRGYQTDLFSGDTGFYLGAEARFALLGAGGRPETPFFNSLNLVAFVDGGGAFPYRANGTTPIRADFATSVGFGVEATMLRNLISVFAGAAQPLDAVHVPLHGNRTRLLFQAALRVPFGGG